LRIDDWNTRVTHSADIAHRLQSVAHALRQRRRLRLSVRAIWLTLIVWSFGLFAALIGVELSRPLVLGLTIMTLVSGLAYAWFSHPSLEQLARGLDDHYKLAQQLGTALEVAQRDVTQPLEERLLGETEELLARMRRFFATQPLIPWREVETCLAVMLLTLGLTVATRPLLPEAQSPVALPNLPPPVAPTEAAQLQPTEQPVNEQQPPLSPEAQQAAEAIADALRDNGATRSAAEALDQGNPSEAASELRELADQADQLGRQAREDIAQGLREAAEQLSGSQPDLAQELEQQADALERGGQEAAEALEDLARTVEQLDQNGEQAAEQEQQNGDNGEQGEQQAGQGQQNGQQAGGEQPGGQSGGGSGTGDQLGGEQRGAQDDAAQAQGDPLPLPQSETTDGPTTPATGPRGPTIQLGAGGTGETANTGDSNSSERLQGEADPLTIPSEYRDVVEDYFSPNP
jgi:ribosome-binding protein aMBF1 (putative translation factor)